MWSFLRRFSKTSTSFSRIPVQCDGELFVSPMPFGRYDGERVFRWFKREKLDRVVVLLSDEEIRKRCRKDLKRVYRRAGFKITQYPMEDFLQPGKASIDSLIPELLDALRAGERLVIHCHAGVGRTAVVIACLVAALHGSNATETVSYIRHYMETNLTAEQRAFIENWVEHMRASAARANR